MSLLTKPQQHSALRIKNILGYTAWLSQNEEQSEMYTVLWSKSTQTLLCLIDSTLSGKEVKSHGMMFNSYTAEPLSRCLQSLWTDTSSLQEYSRPQLDCTFTHHHYFSLRIKVNENFQITRIYNVQYYRL